VADDDRVHLPEDDFRRERALLSPELFADPGTGSDLPATDLVSKEAWTGLIDLPTDVLLRTTSHEGSSVDVLHRLTSMWIDLVFRIDESSAPYMSEASLLAYEEFDALAFIALHGYYRQALGCLRNALEVLTVGAGLAVNLRNSATRGVWAGSIRLVPVSSEFTLLMAAGCAPYGCGAVKVPGRT
jgi:hypothetical protein